MIKAIESDADTDRRLRRAPYRRFHEVSEAIGRRLAEKALPNIKNPPNYHALASRFVDLAKVWVSWAVLARQSLLGQGPFGPDVDLLFALHGVGERDFAPYLAPLRERTIGFKINNIDRYLAVLAAG